MTYDVYNVSWTGQLYDYRRMTLAQVIDFAIHWGYEARRKSRFVTTLYRGGVPVAEVHG